MAGVTPANHSSPSSCFFFFHVGTRRLSLQEITMCSSVAGNLSRKCTEAGWSDVYPAITDACWADNVGKPSEVRLTAKGWGMWPPMANHETGSFRDGFKRFGSVRRYLSRKVPDKFSTPTFTRTERHQSSIVGLSVGFMSESTSRREEVAGENRRCHHVINVMYGDINLRIRPLVICPPTHTHTHTPH